MEDFLAKINRLTPIQASKKNYKYQPYKKTKDFQILKETQLLHQQRKDLSKIQIIEFSILFIILNYLDIASKKLEDLSEIEFLADKNESLKKEITSYLIEGKDKKNFDKIINVGYDKIIKEINENSNIQIIIKDKNEEEITNLLEELLKTIKSKVI